MCVCARYSVCVPCVGCVVLEKVHERHFAGQGVLAGKRAHTCGFLLLFHGSGRSSY